VVFTGREDGVPTGGIDYTGIENPWRHPRCVMAPCSAPKKQRHHGRQYADPTDVTDRGNDAILAGDTGNDDLIYGLGGSDTISRRRQR
jgi:hypothetical protein